jgi:hypothetical protein
VVLFKTQKTAVDYDGGFFYICHLNKHTRYLNRRARASRDLAMVIDLWLLF